MKTIINILFVATIFLMSGSCSSSWHLNRAIKKNPSIITNKIDTLEVIVPGATKVIHAKDSIIVNEPGVYIKVNAVGDSLTMFYEFLPDTIRIIDKQTAFNVPKSRQQIRQEQKTARTDIRKTERTKRTELQTDSKTIQKKQKLDFRSKNLGIKYTFFIIIGFLLGFIACLFLVKSFNTRSS